MKKRGRQFLVVALLPLLLSCGQKAADTTAQPEALFDEFLGAIPKQPLPLQLSCGLPEETKFSTDFEKYKTLIPPSTDRVFGAIDSRSDDYKLIIYGITADRIYPILFSLDNQGQVKDSVALILNSCGGADHRQIPHSAVVIKDDLTIELTDTTRLIHFPATATPTGGYILDSLRISRVVLKVDEAGRFVIQ